MIRTWPGQTHEEYVKEFYRHYNLTQAEKDKEFEEVYGTFEERQAKREQERLQRIKEKEERQKRFDEKIARSDHPNTMDNGTATFFWVVIMIIAAIFKDRWLIWIFATVVWLLHITRHERAAAKREINKNQGDDK